MINDVDYVELGLACADVCTTLNRGLKGKSLDDLNDSVVEAINQLMTSVTLPMHISSTPLTILSAWLQGGRGDPE